VDSSNWIFLNKMLKSFGKKLFERYDETTLKNPELNTLVLRKRWRHKSLHSNCSTVTYKLWNMCIHIGLLYAIKMWTISNGKFEVVSFVIKLGRNLTSIVKHEVNVKLWGFVIKGKTKNTSQIKYQNRKNSLKLKVIRLFFCNWQN